VRHVTALVVRARALADRWRTSVGASTGGGLVGRAILLVIGLLVLAWIGRLAPAPARALARLPDGAARLAAADLAGAPAAPAPSAAPSPSAPPPPPPAAPPPPPAQPPGTRARATPEDPVYVNHASAEELRRLPGVGPKRAEAIVALRQRMGRFQRIEDLLRVKGIGRTTLRRWRPLLRLDAPDAGAP
jgi:competence protein ComEA